MKKKQKIEEFCYQREKKIRLKKFEDFLIWRRKFIFWRKLKKK